MAQKDIGPNLDRQNRNNHVDNYTQLFEGVQQVKKTIDDLVLESGGDSNLEVVQARGGENTLNSRLDKLDDKDNEFTSQLAETEQDVTSIKKTKMDKSIGATKQELLLKSDQSYVENVLSELGSLTPKGVYETIQDLKDEYPNGAEGVFLTTTDGHWNYWNGEIDEWTDGGAFQSDGTKYNSIGVSEANETLIDSIYNIIDMSEMEWEIGSIDSGSGKDSDSWDNRLRNKGKRNFSNCIVRLKSNNIRFIVFMYSESDGEYIASTGFRTGDYYVPNDIIVRIVLAYTDNRTIEDDTISGKIQVIKPKTDYIGNDIDAFKTILDLNVTPNWEIGSIDSGSGKDSDSFTNRIRTGFLPRGKYIIMPNSSSEINILKYDSNKQFIKSTGFIVSEYEVSENEHIRIVAKYPSSKEIEDIDDLAKHIDVYGLKNAQDSTQGNVTEVSGTDDVFFSTTINSESDLTMVGNELWTFFPSNDEHTDYKKIRRYSIDFDLKEVSLIGEISHNFGHVNTVDYCEDNNTLIFGNGSGSYDLEGKIYLIKNPYDFAESEKVDINDVALSIDCEGCGFGSKFNVVWGDENGGMYNVCYLITNDNKDVRKLLLGKGNNDLGMGQFSTGKNNDEFNGSFKVLDHWVQESEGYPDVVQGGYYRDGILYTGAGHDGIRYWENELLRDGTIKRVDKLGRIYDGAGDEIFTSMNGLTFYGDYFLIKYNKALHVIELK